MTDADNRQLPRDSVPEPVSPELVLVDPELAAQARERLQDTGEDLRYVERAEPDGRDRRAAGSAAVKRDESGAGSTHAVPTAQFADRAVPVDKAEDATSFSRARRRRRRAALFLSTLLAAAGIGVFVVSQDLIDIGGSTRDRTLVPARTTPTNDSKQTQRSGRAKRRPRAPARTTPSSGNGPTAPKKRRRPTPPPEFPTRVFVWPPVARATFYKVEFFRRGRKVFQAFPRKPRLELPVRWVFRGRHRRLTSGAYRWDVRPAFGSRARPRFGKLITRSTWVAH
jgi:hypothetical protein